MKSAADTPWRDAENNILDAVCTMLDEHDLPGSTWRNQILERVAQGHHHRARRDVYAILLLAANKWTRFMTEECLAGDPDFQALLSRTIPNPQVRTHLALVTAYAVHLHSKSKEQKQ